MFDPLDAKVIAANDAPVLRRHAASGLRHCHFPLPTARTAIADYAAMLVVPTPAADNSGATHALEHLVLSGSRRFPYRDAFFRMERRSLASELNAVTNEWLSTFHFVTPSAEDFFNLLEFMVDGVFNPLLAADTFAEEVVRSREGGAAGFTGVVYNEMSAMTAMPGLLLDVAIRGHLYPGQAFGYLSGGFPAAIAKLTPVTVREFHARHYRTNRAWLLTSAPIETGEFDAGFARVAPLLPAGGAAMGSGESPAQSSSTSPTPTPNVDVTLPGGVDATVLAWDFGWRADIVGYFEAKLLLDLMSARPDSLLKPYFANGLVTTAHLNVVDGQAGRNVLRIGVARRAGDDAELPSHDELLAAIASVRPRANHVRSACDRLALMESIEGGSAGTGNAIDRLRQCAQVLHADVDSDTRGRWLSASADEAIAELRERYLDQDAWSTCVERLADTMRPPLRVNVVNGVASFPPKAMGTVVAAAAAPAAGRYGGEACDSHEAEPLPLVAPKLHAERVAQARLNRLNEREPRILWANADDKLVEIHLLLRTDDGGTAANVARRVEAATRRGPLSSMVSTRIDIDSWTARLGNNVAGGVGVALTGLNANVEALGEALEALVQLPLRAADDAGNRVDRHDYADGIQAALRTGHLSAVAAALKDQPGHAVRHAVSGLGRVLPSSAYAHSDLYATVADLVERVVIKAAPAPVDGLYDRLVATLRPSRGDGEVEKANSTGPMTAVTMGEGPKRSLFKIPGSVNYVARVLVPTKASDRLDAERLAAQYVLAAAMRNVHLLTSVRAKGGAYGVGVEPMSEALAFWSFRDPRLGETFADFDLALKERANKLLESELLVEAKLSALRELNRRFLRRRVSSAILASLVHELDYGQTLVDLATKIQTLGADPVRDLADGLQHADFRDAALVGANWGGTDDKAFDEFDYRDSRFA